MKSQGYEIAAMALSGADAIAAAASLRPDVVLMDVRLQGKIDGVERLVNSYNERGVSIVFISAHARALKLADFPAAPLYRQAVRTEANSASRPLHIT